MAVDQDEDAPLVGNEEDDLFIIDQSAQDFLEVKRAEYIGYNRRVQRESEILFVPSTRPGTVHSSKKVPAFFRKVVIYGVISA